MEQIKKRAICVYSESIEQSRIVFTALNVADDFFCLPAEPSMKRIPTKFSAVVIATNLPLERQLQQAPVKVSVMSDLKQPEMIKLKGKQLKNELEAQINLFRTAVVKVKEEIKTTKQISSD